MKVQFAGLDHFRPESTFQTLTINGTTSNSLGSYWLGTYPDSTLKSKMEYYITPAKQTPEVQAELEKITPKEIDPETITVIDPASGSGHILVEAYNLLKEIYSERGYHPRDIPRLILEKNLFGLDIDARAAQLAGLALLMRARADDRNILDPKRPVKLNILEIKGVDFKVDEAVQTVTKGKTFKIEQMAMPFVEQPKQMEMKLKAADELTPQDLKDFIELFKDAKTFGSLITVPEELKSKLPAIEKLTEQIIEEAFRRGGYALERVYALKLQVLVQQARILAGLYEVVVANPPYMGGKYQPPALKNFLKAKFSGFEKDLFSAFIIRDQLFSRQAGRLGFMSPFVWMFISTYEDLRHHVISKTILTSLIQLEYSGFEGATVPICTFTLQNSGIEEHIGSFIRLSEFRGSDNQGPKTLEAVKNPSCGWFFNCKQSDFNVIPGSPIAYWVSDRMRQVFKEGTLLGEIAEPRQGLATSDNARFLRRWFEVSRKVIGIGYQSREAAASSGKKWFPYNKGGDFRKWYGNNEYVINWAQDGKEVIGYAAELYGSATRTIKNIPYYFKPGITWTFVSSANFGVRVTDPGFIFDVGGSTSFPASENLFLMQGLLASSVVERSLEAINPTLNFQAGSIAKVPYLSQRVEQSRSKVEPLVKRLCQISRLDWDSFETSWGFAYSPLVPDSSGQPSLTKAYEKYVLHCLAEISEMQSLETENNRLFIQAYGLESELSPEVPESEITLHRPDRYEDTTALLSYAIGCMMGRYSLDEPGLVYANSGNVGFDPSRYKKFPADEDGIIPLMDSAWFEDDATARFLSFLKVVWGEDTFDENIKFVADSLSSKDGETPQETIQRYFSDSFFKDHLKTYKKRPIYWLFSSGKEGAFQALVYLHRYNESTLSKMRTDYVLKLQAKMNSEDKKLSADIEAAHSTAERTKLRKALEKLHKKQEELRKFDEVLHHYADQRIALDLDDGVKVNYGKLAPLLAEVKQVTGGSEE